MCLAETTTKSLAGDFDDVDQHRQCHGVEEHSDTLAVHLSGTGVASRRQSVKLGKKGSHMFFCCFPMPFCKTSRGVVGRGRMLFLRTAGSSVAVVDSCLLAQRQSVGIIVQQRIDNHCIADCWLVGTYCALSSSASRQERATAGLRVIDNRLLGLSRVGAGLAQLGHHAAYCQQSHSETMASKEKDIKFCPERSVWTSRRVDAAQDGGTSTSRISRKSRCLALPVYLTKSEQTHTKEAWRKRSCELQLQHRWSGRRLCRACSQADKAAPGRS